MSFFRDMGHSSNIEKRSTPSNSGFLLHDGVQRMPVAVQQGLTRLNLGGHSDSTASEAHSLLCIRKRPLGHTTTNRAFLLGRARTLVNLEPLYNTLYVGGAIPTGWHACSQRRTEIPMVRQDHEWSSNVYRASRSLPALRQRYDIINDCALCRH